MITGGLQVQWGGALPRTVPSSTGVYISALLGACKKVLREASNGLGGVIEVYKTELESQLRSCPSTERFMAVD